MIEVERKYRIANKTPVLASLNNLNYSKNDKVHQSDRVYLKNSESFEKFMPTDPVMRIRTVGQSHKLTYKRSINKAGDAIEHEMSIDPVEAGEGMLRELGFQQVTVVKKMRTEYTKGDVTIALDDVETLGSFVEVEVVCEEGEEEFAELKVASAAAELSLMESNIETKKYDRLMSEAIVH